MEIRSTSIKWDWHPASYGGPFYFHKMRLTPCIIWRSILFPYNEMDTLNASYDGPFYLHKMRLIPCIMVTMKAILCTKRGWKIFNGVFKNHATGSCFSSKLYNNGTQKTYLSLIPVCSLEHRTCRIYWCQLISVCFHNDAWVELQGKQNIGNLGKKKITVIINQYYKIKYTVV